MLETQLILFEGLPGSGKSTQAQWLEVQLKHRGIPAHWHWEGDVNHPLNWFLGEWWLPDFDMMHSFADLPATIQRCLANWERFVQAARESETLAILENWPFLNSVFMFIQGGADMDSLRAFARDMQQIIAPLNPALIYFHQSETRQALQRILEIRGPNFERELFHNMSRFPFCSQRDLADFECVAALWEAHQALMAELLPGYAPHQMGLDVTSEAWLDYRQVMLSFLKVTEPTQTSAPNFNALAGKYQGERQLDIRLEAGVLVAYEQSKATPLIWLEDYRFYWQGLPITITFESNGTGLRIDSTRVFGQIVSLDRFT
jgi:thymidylate kinase